MARRLVEKAIRETENDDGAHQWLRPGDAKLCSDRRERGEARRRYDYRAEDRRRRSGAVSG